MTSHHLARNRPNMGQALITAVETIASAMSDYVNKRDKERPDMDKCIDSLRALGLPNVIYFKALNIIEIERGRQNSFRRCLLVIVNHGY